MGAPVSKQQCYGCSFIPSKYFFKTRRRPHLSIRLRVHGINRGNGLSSPCSVSLTPPYYRRMRLAGTGVAWQFCGSFFKLRLRGSPRSPGSPPDSWNRGSLISRPTLFPGSGQAPRGEETLYCNKRCLDACQSFHRTAVAPKRASRMQEVRIVTEKSIVHKYATQLTHCLDLSNFNPTVLRPESRHQPE